MSVKVSSWVWHEAPKAIAGNELVVLLALADVADDHGHCVYLSDPSEGTREALAVKARVSVATFKRSVQSLSERGVLAVSRGRQHAPNTYRIVMDQGVHSEPSVSIQEGQSEPSEDSRRVKSDVQTAQKVGSDGSTVTRLKEDVYVTRMFERFYKVYPRHVARVAAEKAFVRWSKRVDPEVIVRAAERFAVAQAETEPKFIPYPASWLNAGRWDDEPDVPDEVGEPVEENVTQLRMRRELAEAKARWLSERGVTEAEYEANKGNPAWLAGLEVRHG